MITEAGLQDMYERSARGEALSADESLGLVMKVRKLESDLSGMDELYNTLSLQMEWLRAERSKGDGRLRYVLQQLGREARFKRRDVPENSRFYRAYDTLVEIVG